jgi:hypothetical protein
MADNKIILRDQMPIGEIMSIGKAFQESGMFPDIKSAAQAIVKIQAGQEIGISPFAAMTGIHIIQGRPTIGAGLIASKVKSSGKYDYKVKEMTEKACVLDFYEGKELLGTSSFTIEDAKKAETKNINKFPKNMLFARAISNGVKWFCPDVFNGPVYTPEDFNEEHKTEDVTAEVVYPSKSKLIKEEKPGLTEDELWQWQAALNSCMNENDLALLYKKEKATVNSEPQVFEMFKERKKQLA